MLYRFTEDEWELLEQAVINYSDRVGGVIPRTILHGYLSMHNRDLAVTDMKELGVLASFFGTMWHSLKEEGRLPSEYNDDEEDNEDPSHAISPEPTWEQKVMRLLGHLSDLNEALRKAERR